MFKVFKHISLLIGLIGVFQVSYAQQDPQFTQFTRNQAIYNPAYAGSVGEPDNAMFQFSVFHRSQWAGSYTGELGTGYQPPVTQTLTLNRPLAVDKDHIERLGGILTIVNDQLGYVTNRSISVGGAYHLTLHGNEFNETEYKNLYFGLSFGMKQFGVDFSNAELNPKQTGDPVIQQTNQTVFTPDVGFGVLFKTGIYYIGASAPHLLETSLAFVDSSVAKQSRHYYLSGGVTINRNKKVTISPNFFAKYIAGVPMQVNANIIAEYMETFWIGGGYRMNDAVEFMAGVNLVGAISEDWYGKGGKFLIGYAADYHIGDIPNISPLTHEIMVVMNFSLEKDRTSKFHTK